MTSAGGTGGMSVRVVVGLLIVGFGLAVMLDNLDLFEVGNLLHYWPFALILVGLVKLLQDDTRSGRTAGGLLTLVGVLFAAEIFVFHRFDVWRWWPLAIVVFGVLIILKALRGGEATARAGTAGASGVRGLPGQPAGMSAMPGAPGGPGPLSPSPAVGSTTMDQKIEEWAIWSGIERRVASPAFRRADLTAVMGGIDLDLRQAGTDQGEAVIEVFVLWGGIEIKVPPDWAVSNDVSVIMGGAEDKSSGTQQARNRLIVKGVVIMGGVDITT
jgi:predicted membrane protein